MTGGFNTDIVLDGVVYHIQTEDKGSKVREIVTQVFREGAVILTRRTPYPAAGKELRNVAEVEALVRHQHVKLLHFIRGGGLKKDEFLHKGAADLISPEVEGALSGIPPTPQAIADQKSSGASAAGNARQEEFRKTRSLGTQVTSALRQVSAKRTTPPAPPKLAVPPGDATQIIGSQKSAAEPTKQIPRPSIISRSRTPAPPSAVVSPDPNKTEELFLDEFLRDLIGEPKSGISADSETPSTETGPPATPVSPSKAIQQNAPVAPLEPPAVATPIAYAEGEKCEVLLLSSRTIRSGEVQPLSLRLQSDKQRLPLPNARVIVRIFGKTIRPITFSGRSNQEGVFNVEILVPHYTVGDGHVEVQVHSILGSRTLVLDVTRATASK